MDLEKFFEDDSQEQEFNFDFRRYLLGIYQRKWIVISICLALIIPWLFYLKSLPPEYEAQTYLRFKNYDLETLRLLNQSRYIELTSRTFAEKIVAKLGLVFSLSEEDQKEGLIRHDLFSVFYTNTSPEEGKYKLSFDSDNFKLYRVSMDGDTQKEIAAGPLSEVVDKELEINGFAFKVKPEILQIKDEIEFELARFRNAVKWFSSKVNINFTRGGTLMQIRMVHHNPIIVAEMVNSLAGIYVAESVSFEKKKATETRTAIQNQLEFAKAQLDKDQDALRRFKESHFISLDTDVQKKVDNLTTFETGKRNLESYTENLSDLLNKLNDLGSKVITPGQDDKEIRYIYSQITKNLLFQDNASMGLFGEQIKDLEEQRGVLIEERGMPVTVPRAVQLDEQIAEFQNQVFDLAKNQLQSSILEIRRIDGRIKQLENEINKLPGEQLRLSDLTKNVDVSNNLYIDLRKRAQELDITEAVDTEEIDILDPAIVPELPVNRGKKKNAIAGGIFAIFFSMGVAILLEFMDKSIKSPDDIKKYLKLNVIGTIPKLSFDHEFDLRDSDKLRQIDSQLVTYDYSPTPIGEAYRALRTKIVFSKNLGKISSLVVTSFAPGDGKSFTSSNLAVTLAQHKTTTLIIDADLRRGVLHNTFGVSKEPGLSNYLMGMVGIDELIHETHIPNLSMISCGSMMPNPSELLGSVQLKRFVDEIRRHYDLVMFDTPPLNAATDSVVLGTQVEGVVLIVRADVTNRNVAKQKLDLFENVPANIIGVVLNGTETELAHEGYSYYHY